MTRGARLTLLAFGVSLVGVLAGIAHISSTTVELVEREAEARRQAALEENVRLALWRFDSTLAALIAREGARPYFTYAAVYPSGRGYDRMFDALTPGEVAVPSPLLTETSDDVRLHFLVAPSGRVSSPEVPEGAAAAHVPAGLVDPERAAERAARLEGLRARLAGSDLAARVPLEGLRAEAIGAEGSGEGGEARESEATALQKGEGRGPQEESLEQGTHLEPRKNVSPEPKAIAQVAKKVLGPRSKSSAEWLMRSRSVQQAASYNTTQNVDPTPYGARLGRVPSVRLGALEEGPVTPLWVGCPARAEGGCSASALVLARRVRHGGDTYIVGAWLDWPKIRADLLAGAQDLLPNADLLPLDAAPGARDRRLASLPVHLIPGEAPAAEAADTAPVLITLGVAWVGVLLAAAAVAALLFGTLALSERRAIFVSAVTHELRTPLTTFRMYSEMLADGMVTDPEKSRAYLETLRREAVRLSHLVENVLAYARIERGRHTGRIEPLVARDVVERLADRLRDRALAAGMALDLATPPEGASWSVRADATAVEQILFNLVDNACKYAASADDKRIEVTLAAGDRRVLFRVRDRGPGLARDARRRLFSPFSKSAEVAAVSAPGVGLGLALSRRLARSMGGDLELEPASPGASFVLSLPAV